MTDEQPEPNEETPRESEPAGASDSMSFGSQPSVIVVGGGLAGRAAAHERAHRRAAADPESLDGRAQPGGGKVADRPVGGEDVEGGRLVHIGRPEDVRDGILGGPHLRRLADQQVRVLIRVDGGQVAVAVQVKQPVRHQRVAPRDHPVQQTNRSLLALRRSHFPPRQ